jgi:Zn-dependent protease with chaperone function
MKIKNDATSSLFIDSPYKGKQKTNWLVKLFSTHPPVEDRIAALRGMDIKN